VRDLVTPAFKNGRYLLAWDDVSVEVDAAVGGRVTALRLGGHDLLTGRQADIANYGSTFWTSPQTAWGWPPVPEIDHLPYTAAIEGETIVMASAPSAALGVEVEKRFAADRGRGAVLFDFRIVNRGATPLPTAPWQITRVRPGGLTFFPTGDGNYAPSNLAVRETLGVTWYAYDAAAVTENQKLFADGREGWLAHLDLHGDGGALLIKTFAVMPRAAHAPGEAQIEIYASPLHTYVEVEAQGAYQSIAPGASLDWRVVWLVRRLPPGLPCVAGSAELLAYVRAMVGAEAIAAAAAASGATATPGASE
jgi:hypothetical protein